jgi:hypothetical protein
MASTISPELALVDPILRTDALAALPHVEPFDFLRFPDDPVAPPRRPPLAVAAAVYTVSAAARVAVMDGLFVLALAAVVLAANVLH